MKPAPPRTVGRPISRLSIDLSPTELDQLETAAQAAGVPVRQWVREVALAAAKKGER